MNGRFSGLHLNRKTKEANAIGIFECRILTNTILRKLQAIEKELRKMLLTRVICENVGPIQNISFKPRTDHKGNPIPIVLVGENGSGKSILLSNIVDAFFEFADLAYVNATPKLNGGHEYYKIISSNQINVNSSFMATYLEFSVGSERMTYYCKAGECNAHQFSERYSIDGLDWKKEGNDKGIIATKETAEKAYEHNVLCYYPPSRYERPNWMGMSYYDRIGLSFECRFNGELHNQIIVNNAIDETMQWLLDVIADSRCDLEVSEQDHRLHVVYPSVEQVLLFSKGRSNIEKILSTIIGKKVHLRMEQRKRGPERLSIWDDNGLIIPSLDALSTGQMALFLLFVTIMRYGDDLNLNNSIHLENIQGIVLIDEIDLHLHSSLQRNVLARLLKLFPKVQFIISTHAPLVLLGLREVYGEELDIIEMPTGSWISAESFTEFDKAYSYFTETNRYQQDIRKTIEKLKSEKPLIVTEGPTDWRHFKAARTHLEQQDGFEWLRELDFEFLEYEPVKSSEDARICLDIGAGTIKKMAEEYSKIKQDRIMIFIADNDVDDTYKAFIGANTRYRNWGNNVYSMVLPVPDYRKDNPDICIEHLYKDSEIKQWVSGENYRRRIFMGNEFDKNGFHINDDEHFFCCDKNACTSKKNPIIDGGGDKKVIGYGIEDKTKNYALSKMQFAKMVLSHEDPFSEMDFSEFIPVFEAIRDIICSN